MRGDTASVPGAGITLAVTDPLGGTLVVRAASSQTEVRNQSDAPKLLTTQISQLGIRALFTLQYEVLNLTLETWRSPSGTLTDLEQTTFLEKL